MFLAVDVGNSNIVLGIYANGSWAKVWRVETDPGKKRDDYLSQFRTLFEGAGLAAGDVRSSMIASVVPSLNGELAPAIEQLTRVRPIMLSHQSDTGIVMETDRPEEIGPDLIAGIVAGYHIMSGTCIVVDFGTATTLMAVKEPGVLTGGAICAGLKITAEALVGRAAMLSDIPLVPPPKVLARGTVEAMQSGLVMGHICMVEGLIDRMKKELGEINTKVIATGGLAEMLADRTTYFDRVDPLLTLKGMRIIEERHDRQKGIGNRQK